MGMAAQYGGRCFLRFDDTNPEAEKREYIDHIQEIVAWLGYTPWKACRSGISPRKCRCCVHGLTSHPCKHACCSDAKDTVVWRRRQDSHTSRQYMT